MRELRIVGFGSVLVDALAHVTEEFLSGSVSGAKGGMEMISREDQQKLIAKLQDYSRSPGGAAGNTIFALAHLGMDVGMFSKVGKDDPAEFYRTRLTETGGKAFFLETEDAGTGVCVSLVTPDSERTMRSYLGASQLITCEEAEAFDYGQTDMIYIEGYQLFLPGLVQTVLRRAKSAGCRTAMDLASFEVMKIFRKDVTALLEEGLVDMVFANEEEAAALLDSTGSPEEMAQILGKSCHVAAVKCGAAGSWICRDNALTAIAIEPVRAVDTTAAGDTWAAGYLYGYWSGLDDLRAGKIASLVSAEVVQVTGSEMPEETWSRIRNAVQTIKQD